MTPVDLDLSMCTCVVVGGGVVVVNLLLLVTPADTNSPRQEAERASSDTYRPGPFDDCVLAAPAGIDRLIDLFHLGVSETRGTPPTR